MLVTILIIAFITTICWLWGDWIFMTLKVDLPTYLNSPFIISSITGLIFITTISSYISLLTKLDSVYIIPILTLIPLLRLKNIRFRDRSFITLLKSNSTIYFLFINVILVLIMSVWEIKHPDTIEYHLAIIRDLEDNGLTTGLANQNLRLGLQSNWYIITALFSFERAPLKGLSYANIAIVVWLVVFMVNLLQEMMNKQNSLFFFSLILLMFLMWLDYTQIRLTTTSTSTDFIITILILVSFYLFHKNNTKDNYKLVPIILATYCLTLKISALPILLLICYQIFSIKRMQTRLVAIFSFLIIISPFLVRNYFTSGYLLYPSAFPEFGRPEWAVSTSDINYLKDYIQAYARTGSTEDISSVSIANELPFQKWISIWWNLRNYGQKIILIGSTLAILLFPVLGIINKRQFMNSETIITLATAITGIFFWFYSAPDPRFGTSWFYLFSACFINLLLPRIKLRWHNLYATFVIYSLSMVLSFYIAYRLIYFFKISNLLLPTH